MKETRGWDSKSANVIIHDDHSVKLGPRWMNLKSEMADLFLPDQRVWGHSGFGNWLCHDQNLLYPRTVVRQYQIFRYISNYIKLFHNFDWIKNLIEIPGGSQFSGCFCLRYSACSLSETTLSLPQSRRSVVPLVVVVVSVVFVVAIDIFAFNQQNFVTSYYPQSSF